MSPTRLNLYKALTESQKMYAAHGARSSKKLVPLHQYFRQLVEAVWGKAYSYHVIGLDNKEKKVPGQYYDKNIDLVVAKDNVAVFALGFKYVTSNYSQNSNNYFENMLGETANIQRANVPYAQVIIIRDPMPYKKKDGSLARYEKIGEHNLAKYIKLAFDQSYPHKPFATCVELVEVSDEGLVTQKKLEAERHGEGFYKLHDKHLSLEELLRQVKDFKTFYESQTPDKNYPWLR